MFVQLPEYITCSVRGINSPVIFRAEAGCQDGGMAVEELRDMPPSIAIYGDVTAARVEFQKMLSKLRYYLDQADNRQSRPCVSSRWFRIEYRSADYNACFWGDVTTYDLEWSTSMHSWLAPPVKQDFTAVYDRLIAIYSRFFDVNL